MKFFVFLCACFVRVMSEGNSRYGNLRCEVGRRINDRPDDFHEVECDLSEDTCQTKWEIHEDGRRTIEKVCQTQKGCNGSANVNIWSCYTENALNTNNRLCFHCCTIDRCNRFDFVPSYNGIEETFQRRFDGSVDFDQTWDEYKNGFGNRQGEFWTGLENLHLMTYMYDCDLEMTIEFLHDQTLHGTWTYFRIKPESDNYRMLYDSYDGMLGNGLVPHRNFPFSTRDRDNDRNSNRNCAGQTGGGWWFGRRCNGGSLNAEGALERFNIKSVVMKVVCDKF